MMIVIVIDISHHVHISHVAHRTKQQNLVINEKFCTNYNSSGKMSLTDQKKQNSPR